MMARADYIERTIWTIEGFQVRIMQGGLDVRGDKNIPARYNADRMSKNSFTVGEWKQKFQRQFPGYDVEVLDGNGKKVRGNVKLSTVRDTYL